MRSKWTKLHVIIFPDVGGGRGDLDVGHDAGGAVVRVGGEGEVDGDDVDGAAQVDQEPRVGVVGGGGRTLEP